MANVYGPSGASSTAVASLTTLVTRFHNSSGVGLKSTRKAVAETFRSKGSDSTFYSFQNGNFLALSHEDQNPVYPRSIVVVDDTFCIFSGALNNTRDLRRYYGLSRQATEAMIVIEAYKVLRDRAPYPLDQVIKELEGKFAFILFDLKALVLLLARDSEGSVQLHWGTAADRSLVCSDDANLISTACGKCYSPFPPESLRSNSVMPSSASDLGQVIGNLPQRT